MQRHGLVLFKPTRHRTFARASSTYIKRTGQPIVSIQNATFYRQQPSATAYAPGTNPDLFPNLTFELPSKSSEPEYWCVIGPSSSGKTTFCDILRGQHLCFPPTARSFPYLSSPKIERKDPRLRIPSHAIQYVGFAGKGGGGIRGGSTAGAYLSARYESRREETDFSVLDYLKGNLELNPSDTESEAAGNKARLKKVIGDLKLKDLVDMPVGNLSNGQTRRAKIAKALLGEPEVLLLDEPFMGLDPPTLTTLSPLLFNLAAAQSPRIVLSLRPQDPLPDWITHVVYLGPELRVAHQGPKDEVLEAMNKEEPQPAQVSRTREGVPLGTRTKGFSQTLGEPIVEMRNIQVKYGDKIALGNWSQTSRKGRISHGLDWTVHRNSRWGVFGPNGSGKTTLLSLICSDHPQSYSLPIKLFSKPRLPRPGQPGISLFDLQSRIGHSSPEIHNFFPKHLSLRRCLESAWSDTFLSPPQLTYARDSRVDVALRWFEPELNPTWTPPPVPKKKTKYQDSLDPPRRRLLEHAYKMLDMDASTDWAETFRFGDLPFSAQRLALFLRALVKTPDLVVLDEAFSGMDAALRDKCMLFLTWGTARVFAGPRSELNRTKGLDVRPWPKVDGPALRPEELIPGLSEEQALVCVSHVKEEVPGLVRHWMCLPEAEGAGKVRFGKLRWPLEKVEGAWEEIWGIPFGKGEEKEKDEGRGGEGGGVIDPQAVKSEQTDEAEKAM